MGVQFFFVTEIDQSEITKNHVFNTYVIKIDQSQMSDSKIASKVKIATA